MANKDKIIEQHRHDVQRKDGADSNLTSSIKPKTGSSFEEQLMAHIADSSSNNQLRSDTENDVFDTQNNNQTSQEKYTSSDTRIHDTTRDEQIQQKQRTRISPHKLVELLILSCRLL